MENLVVKAVCFKCDYRASYVLRYIEEGEEKPQVVFSCRDCLPPWARQQKIPTASRATRIFNFYDRRHREHP